MRIIAVIPARYASTRLPAKPLADICGKPMIQWVWEAAAQAQGLDAVFMATDDERIKTAVEAFGGKVVMTSPDCLSGTDRVRQVAEQHPADVYINVQGDEPLMATSAIETLASLFTQATPDVATLAYPITPEDAQSPAQVKVVCDHNGNALYFSRSPIPYVRNQQAPLQYLGHAGIYAYRAEILSGFSSLPPSPLEQLESLEQLRLLQAGVPIKVAIVPAMGAGVDTLEDLERVRTIMQARKREAALQKLKNIKLIITDVDGVLTDGGLYYGPDGECLKRFHVHDGYAVHLLKDMGIQLVVLSGRDCPALRKRLQDLGITEYILGELDKKNAVHGIMERCGVTKNETAFVGDDLPDLDAFSEVGIGVAVANARSCVKQYADIILHTAGGFGALRELTEMLQGAR